MTHRESHASPNRNEVRDDAAHIWKGKTMSDDPSLREQARALLESGRLAGRRPNRVWGGPAHGANPCMVCGAPARPGEVVLEVEFARDGAANPHFHVRCFAALESEIRSLEASARADLSDPAQAAASSTGGLSHQDGA
jgi:hypothetical protein